MAGLLRRWEVSQFTCTYDWLGREPPAPNSQCSHPLALQKGDYSTTVGWFKAGTPGVPGFPDLTLDKIFALSVPQFLPLYNEDN